VTEPHIRWTWRIVSVVASLLALWVVVGFITPWRGEIPGLGRAIPWIPDRAATSSLFWTVDQNERGVVLRFGQVVRTVGPGIHFTLPWPAETLVRVSTTSVNQISVGFKILERAENLRPSASEVEWLTGDTNIVELQAMVLWTVKDVEMVLFGFTESAPRDYKYRSLPAHGSFLLRRSAESVFTRMIATSKIDDILTSGKMALQAEVQRAIQTELDELQTGIAVAAVNITEVNPPLRAISAFNEVSNARADRARRIDEARGYEMQVKPRTRSQVNRLMKDAEVYRTEVLNEAQGTASSFEKLAAEIEKHGTLAKRRVWLDAVERIVARGRKIMVQPIEAGETVNVWLDSGSN